MRRFRTQQRKRQTWLALPASGIEEAGHGQEWKRAIGEGRREADRVRREGIATRCRVGTRNILKEIMAWNEDTEQASVIEGCLRYVHSLGPEDAREALKARHEIVISENVARKVYSAGQHQASRLDAEES